MSSNKYPIGKFYEDVSELPKDVQTIIKKATEQLDMAYAPYSNFYVGAAALYNNGEIALGCNQENASYPLCICAERVALFQIGANNSTFNIKALAITARNPAKPLKEICMPCGACRQVINEFEQRQESPIILYLTSEGNGVLEIEGISPLLPYSFSKSALL